MFFIEYKFDTSDESDSIDLLGDIKIRTNENEIIDRNTYIDAWMYAFITLYNEINKKDRIEIDLIDEPNLLIVERNTGKIILSYGDQKIEINNEIEITDGIINVLEKFIKEIKFFNRTEILIQIEQEFNKMK